MSASSDVLTLVDFDCLQRYTVRKQQILEQQNCAGGMCSRSYLCSILMVCTMVTAGMTLL